MGVGTAAVLLGQELQLHTTLTLLCSSAQRLHHRLLLLMISQRKGRPSLTGAACKEGWVLVLLAGAALTAAQRVDGFVVVMLLRQDQQGMQREQLVRVGEV